MQEGVGKDTVAGKSVSYPVAITIPLLALRARKSRKPLHDLGSFYALA
jgi:hypothetical protein